MLNHTSPLTPRDSVVWWGPGRRPSVWDPTWMPLGWWADRYGIGPHTSEDRELAVKEWNAEQTPAR